MKITVYGAGYVGLVTAVCLADIGHEILCFDVDINKILGLRQGIVPIYEDGLTTVLQRNLTAARIGFTIEPEHAVTYGIIHIIAVGTPACDDGTVNLDAIYAIAKIIGQFKNSTCFVVNKSTVPPGTAAKIQQMILETAAISRRELTMVMISNPEFLQEGSAMQQFMYPDRILIGVDCADDAAVMHELYQPWLINHPERLIVMSMRSAELTKYAANALLATKISFINEISQIAELVGADIQEVKRGITADSRINPAFLNPGCGFGGSCFPKDLAGLQKIATTHQFNPVLISAVIQRNAEQQRVLVQKLRYFFDHDLDNKIIAVWGLAFKPNTDDIRCASSQVIISELLVAGAKIQAYDPLAMQAAAKYYHADADRISFCDTALTALAGADALLLVTEWSEFKTISIDSMYNALKNPVVFDGRNVFNPQTMLEMGFKYFSIGRKDTLHVC